MNILFLSLFAWLRSLLATGDPPSDPLGDDPKIGGGGLG